MKIFKDDNLFENVISKIKESFNDEDLISLLDEETIVKFVSVINNYDEQTKDKFVCVSNFIDEQRKNLSAKIPPILTAGILLGTNKEDIKNLSLESMDVISDFLSYLSVDSYDEYLRMFNDENLMQEICNKSNKTKDRLDTFILVEDTYFAFAFDELPDNELDKYYKSMTKFISNCSQEEIAVKAEEINQRMNEQEKTKN